MRFTAFIGHATSSNRHRPFHRLYRPRRIFKHTSLVVHTPPDNLYALRVVVLNANSYKIDLPTWKVLDVQPSMNKVTRLIIGFAQDERPNILTNLFLLSTSEKSKDNG